MVSQLNLGSNDIKFAPQEIIQLETYYRKGPAGLFGDLTAKISIGIVSSVYIEGTPQVRVSTRYKVVLTKQADGSKRRVVATVNSVFSVNMDADRDITSEFAESGGLEPAKDFAAAVLHPYHRQSIADRTTGLLNEPINLPIMWDEIRHLLGESEFEADFDSTDEEP